MRSALRFIVDSYFDEDFLLAIFRGVFAGDFFAAFFVAFFAVLAGGLDFCLAMISERRVLAFSSSAWWDAERFLPARLM
jgi:hypothetical protein